MKEAYGSPAWKYNVQSIILSDENKSSHWYQPCPDYLGKNVHTTSLCVHIVHFLLAPETLDVAMAYKITRRSWTVYCSVYYYFDSQPQRSDLRNGTDFVVACSLQHLRRSQR